MLLGAWRLDSGLRACLRWKQPGSTQPPLGLHPQLHKHTLPTPLHPPRHHTHAQKALPRALPCAATVGVITETNAEKAIEELKAYEADSATVLRGGRWGVMPAGELVPGDVVEVAVGGKIPADVRLVQLLSSTLRIDQVRACVGGGGWGGFGRGAWAQVAAGPGAGTVGAGCGAAWLGGWAP